MATGNQDEAFIINYMKALKFDFQSATTPVQKSQASQKADLLRQNAKSIGVDLSAYGPNVQLAQTPGGSAIDWGMLSNVGKAWAATNPTDPIASWKQQVGTGLTQNLAGYQQEYASGNEMAAYGALAGAPSPTGSAVGAPVTVPQAVATAPAPAVAPVTQPTVGMVPTGYKDSASFQSMLSSLGLGQFQPVKLGR